MNYGLITASIKNNIPADETSTTSTTTLSMTQHSWFINAVDKAGNKRQSSSAWSFNIDTQVPTCQITAPPKMILLEAKLTKYEAGLMMEVEQIIQG